VSLDHEQPAIGELEKKTAGVLAFGGKEQLKFNLEKSASEPTAWSIKPRSMRPCRHACFSPARMSEGEILPHIGDDFGCALRAHRPSMRITVWARVPVAHESHPVRKQRGASLGIKPA